MRNTRRGMKLLAFVATMVAAGLYGLLLAGSVANAMEAAVADTPGYSAAQLPVITDFGLPAVDNILVRKRERRMYLMRQGEILRTYRISLGLSPDGHKMQEGDFRTPEGKYRLIRRNPRSEYFLSMEVSYPNEGDVARARKMGVRPGGAIMIHGLPNTPRKGVDYYLKNDWTDGCIAVSNSDMVEIWMMTPPNTPIEIVP
ncbi:MAG: L,D-transpeptidase family protein [Steroidobacteraceae bacterium]